MKRLIFALVALTLPTLAMAGSSSNVEITAVFYMPGGVVMFDVSAPGHQSPPPCSTAGSRWAIDPADKTIIAGVMLAYAQRRSVDITGKHGCTAWGDTETVHYIVTK